MTAPISVLVLYSTPYMAAYLNIIQYSSPLITYTSGSIKSKSSHLSVLYSNFDLNNNVRKSNLASN